MKPGMHFGLGGATLANIGYLRTDASGQGADSRERALIGSCDVVYTDMTSENDARHPERNKAISMLARGDALHVRTLLDLAGTTRDLIQMVNELIQKGAELVSQDEGIDTRKSDGKVVYGLFALLSKLDKEAIGGWEKQYIQAAKKRAKRR